MSNKKEIIELVQDCKLVKEGNEPNGHDCWGNYEFTSYKYVVINGKQEKCHDDIFVIHDGENVKEVVFDFVLERRKKEEEQKQKIKEHFEKTGFNTPEEYKAYLKGLEELRSQPMDKYPKTTLEEMIRKYPDQFGLWGSEYILKVHEIKDGRIHIYIRPSNRDGETIDFWVDGNILTRIC